MRCTLCCLNNTKARYRRQEKNNKVDVHSVVSTQPYSRALCCLNTRQHNEIDVHSVVLTQDNTTRVVLYVVSIRDNTAIVVLYVVSIRDNTARVVLYVVSIQDNTAT